MPLLPIDLQTLFAQSNQVAKEQAVQRDSAPSAQNLQGAQLVQRTEQRDNAVNETHNQEEGPEQVKARGEGGRNRSRRSPQKKSPQKKPLPPPGRGATPAARIVFQDPALGRTIDITS